MMRPRIQRPFTALPKRQRGAVIVLIVVALASILLMGALALDGGHMLVNKTRLQNAVDAAALSGAKTLSQVLGATGAASLTRDAARDTLIRNANAIGNKELAAAIGGNVAGFAVVELANSVYGPFSFPGPVDARYVRVSVPSYGLTGFFWNFAQSFANGNLGAKAVAAIATAGPSPTSPCDLAPLMVCGVPQPNSFFGYQFGALEVLKTAENNSSGIGPGNFQLLDFGAGGNTVRDLMAGGGTMCAGDTVQTKPGNTVGPAIQGLNTRFGEYGGGLDSSTYPPDWETDYSKAGNDPAIGLLADGETFVFGGTGRDNTGGAPLQTDAQGNITYTDPSTGTVKGVFDYNDWDDPEGPYGTCVLPGANCVGAAERRILKIVIGQCSGTDGGQAQVPVLGFGCFFVLQPAEQKGNESHIFGQFVKDCEGDNVAGPTPADDTGPQIIQLYKTYINGVSTPSTDS